MKTYLTILFCSFLNQAVFAQNHKTSSEILSSNETSSILNDSILRKFKINFPIFRTYRYFDKSGTFLTALTESKDSLAGTKDTFNFKIKAVTLMYQNGDLFKNWEINDVINTKEKEEKTIWFWTKYVEFKDYDNDSIIDPIIVYGTFGPNWYDDGRIKIVIYYQGQKVLLRHQNGTLDFTERTLQIDKAFYTLPAKLQSAVKEKMELMIKNRHAIFPNGWQKSMLKKQTIIIQNNN